MVDVTLRVPALEKLLDYAASGVGRVAGSMLVPWQARRRADAKRIVAEGDADVLLIQAKAQAEARELLLVNDASVKGELDIAGTVTQRIMFQEEKRQLNISAVVGQAAKQLGEAEVPDDEPDHDWSARFFGEVQDVSSAEMQALWARILAGEVAQAGSTSIRTLGILKDLDRPTARLFETLCSACVFLPPDGVVDARVPSLGGNAAQTSLQAYGLNFDDLNRLNEHGLVIPDYNSWIDCRISMQGIPFNFQNRLWSLVPEGRTPQKKTLRLSGVALTRAGRELARVVEVQPMVKFTEALMEYFRSQGLRMVEVAEYSGRRSRTDREAAASEQGS